MNAKPPSMSVPEAAEMLGMSVEQVQSLVEKGKLPALRSPDGWRVTKYSIDTFIRLRKRTDGVPTGWQSPGGGRARSLEEQAKTAQMFNQRVSGIADPSVREKGSLELDMSVLGELNIPPPKPPPAAGE